jgi:hypothetical protein
MEVISLVENVLITKDEVDGQNLVLDNNGK